MTNVYAPLLSVGLALLWAVGAWVLDYQPRRDDWIMTACAVAMCSFDAFWWGYTKGKARIEGPPRKNV